jgi:hypothetical protein
MYYVSLITPKAIVADRPHTTWYEAHTSKGVVHGKNIKLKKKEESGATGPLRLCKGIIM